MQIVCIAVWFSWCHCHSKPTHHLVTRGEFRSWQCEFFEQTKAPLRWTALILDVCEETTIGTTLRNSLIWVTASQYAEILIYRETTNMQSIQINYKQAPKWDACAISTAGSQNLTNYRKFYRFWNNKVKFYGLKDLNALQVGAIIIKDLNEGGNYYIPKPPQTHPVTHLLPHLNPDWFTSMVPAYPGCPGKKRPLKRNTQADRTPAYCQLVTQSNFTK